MVTDAIIGAVAWFVAHVVALFPGWTLPDWLTGLPAGGATIGAFVAEWAVWLPLPVVAGVLVFVVLSFGVTVGVKVVRWIQSSLTGGGGVT